MEFSTKKGAKKNQGRKEYLLTEGAALYVLSKYWAYGCILASLLQGIFCAVPVLPLLRLGAQEVVG
jgi:hypothetical protein